MKLARLSTPVVQAFRDKLVETRSRALARKVLASLKSIIGEAMRRGLVAQNAALPVTVDVKKREQSRLTVGEDVPATITDKPRADLWGTIGESISCSEGSNVVSTGLPTD